MSYRIKGHREEEMGMTEILKLGSLETNDSLSTGIIDRDTENVTVSIFLNFQLGFPKFNLHILLGIRTI